MNPDRPEGLDLGALALLLIGAAVVSAARGMAPQIALALPPQRPRSPRTLRSAPTLAPAAGHRVQLLESLALGLPLPVVVTP
ncbi:MULTISPECIES: hypothetical protein [unclassified Cyanobium]|uniref:hypothetical protein n=1 Tax=unclassified Cyanobium TaxID=2627006 RepID=UPI0020CEB537|nr:MULTISPECIES: hypothetical protein [unclassified Cyanobium]MCP9861081.1 hypothetical protein [Cyanobium sp. Cruz-8H5]MCP9868315.1 hypothetical protein [Cyanobium sp. Cruz-8D1]